MPASSNPKVYIILLNWNGWQDTLECLRSVEALNYSNFEVIIVDNASADNSVDKIQEEYTDIILLESEVNLGYAGGNNIGIRYALEQDAEYVWILNNDTVVDNQALSRLVTKMERDTSIGICGSRLIYYHQRDTIQALAGGTYNKWLGITRNIGQNEPADIEINEEEVEEKLQYVAGASMIVSKSFLKDVGLLSEEYFLYYEEIDWCMRAGHKYRLGFAKDSMVFHKEGASIKATDLQKNNKSRISDYYQIKNRLKFTRKFFPWFLPTVYVTVIYALINRIKRRQWDRLPMIFKLLFTYNRKISSDSHTPQNF